MVKLDRHKARFSGGTNPNRRHNVILQPAADTKKSEVMAPLHAQAQFAEKPQGAFRIASLAQFPAQVEQAIHFITGGGAGLSKELIDNL